MAYRVKTVTVLGLGTLGAQIALQSVVSGYQVRAHDPDENALERFLKSSSDPYRITVKSNQIDLSKWKAAAEGVRTFSSIQEAVRGADLVMEVVPEDLKLKLEVWRQIDLYAPKDAIIATNSSSMPVSKLEGATRRPAQCLNIHFYQLILGQNMADIMGGTQTSKSALEAGKEFVRSLGAVPLFVQKEILGFCFNRVWRAIKKEALKMWADGYVHYHDIDRAWMVFTGSPWGPFGLMDAVGLDVVYDIEMVYYQDSMNPEDHPPEALKDMVRKGKLGVKTGTGFYTYPAPEYLDPEFLRG